MGRRWAGRLKLAWTGEKIWIKGGEGRREPSREADAGARVAVGVARWKQRRGRLAAFRERGIAGRWLSSVLGAAK